MTRILRLSGRHSPIAAVLLLVHLLIADVCFGGQSAAADKRRPNRTAISALGDVDWKQWQSVRGLLEDLHAKTGIPALAAAYVQDGRIVEAAAVGVREISKPDPVRADDPFHLGSVTKSITATVVGALVEKRLLSWDTRVAELLGHLEIHDGYRNVTVEDLLHHRAGLPSYTDGPPVGGKLGGDYRGTPTEIRAAFVADLLKTAPEAAPGETFQYSNAGYAVAGYVAEHVTNMSWRELVRCYVLRPLGMNASGFGFPVTPLGHHGHGPDFTATLPNQYPSMTFIAPAGNVHGSVRDVAAYAIAHLNGLQGKNGSLQSETIERLHRVPPGEGASGYAAGWHVDRDRRYGASHWHAGSVSSSYALLRLLPEHNAGVVVLLTVGANVGEPVCTKVSRTLLDRFLGDTLNSGPMHAEAGSGARFKVVSPSGGDGWATSNPPDKDKPHETVVTLGKASSAENERHWKVIRQLATSFEDEDYDLYKSLFRDSSPRKRQNHKSVFDFMVQDVLPRRGSIRSFHDLSDPMQVEKSAAPVRVAVFHLENGYPGTIVISLDADGKIDHFSLFVKSDICPNGADPLCERSTVKIAEGD